MTFELRIYHANPGKMPQLLNRFRNHTIFLFPKHGIENVGYWIDDQAPEDLIYVLKHNGDPTTNWKNFSEDEDWKIAKEASEVDGRLVASIESKFMSATDFSGIQ
jgi:hypothetical protein